MEFVSAKDEDEPILQRGMSSTLASICAVDKARAREALNLARGDMDAAAMLLMTGTGTEHEQWGGHEGAAVPTQELVELGGVTHTQARSLLAAAGGDLELAKTNLLASLGISTTPEKYSCLLRPDPAHLAACAVCLETPSCADMVVLQQCGHQFCAECLQGWIAAEAESSSSGDIKCPQQGCAHHLGHQELRELLGEDSEGRALFRRIDRRALELLTGGNSNCLRHSLLLTLLSPHTSCLYVCLLSFRVQPRMRVCTCVPPRTAPTSCLGTRRRRAPSRAWHVRSAWCSGV
jgi:hypothetical protein